MLIDILAKRTKTLQRTRITLSEQSTQTLEFGLLFAVQVSFFLFLFIYLTCACVRAECDGKDVE